MSRLLKSHSLDETCFSSYSAEDEPNIDEYFIRPPYFGEVLKRGNSCRSLILFGERGAGKSAARISFYKETWKNVSKGEKAPLVVTLSDFSRIIEGGIAKANLGRFVNEVGYLVTEAVLLWLSAIETTKRDAVINSLDERSRISTAALVDRFYLSRPALARDTTITEPIKLLNLAWHTRTQLWIEKRWDAVRALIGDVAKIALKKGLEVDSKLDESLRDLLAADSSALSNDQYAKALLERLVSTAKIFGFSGILILLDKVDETPLTGNSFQATAAVGYPLLSTTGMLEIDDLGWLFFLWDKVKEPYESGQLAIRLDKIANVPIRWEHQQLVDMVASRMKHFSSATDTVEFSDLCDGDVDAAKILDTVINLSMRSPREVVRILDTILREHDELTASESTVRKLSNNSIEAGLNKYVKDRLPAVFDESHIKYLARLDKKTFLNRDVQQTFKISDQAARARIDNWVKSGLVKFSGVRVPDSESGGKPPNEYSIADTRMIWALEKNLYRTAETLEDVETIE